MRQPMYDILAAAALAVVLALVPPAAAQGPEYDSDDRRPRFLLASASKLVPLDIRGTSVLSRRLSLDLHGVSLKDALAEISRQSGLPLGYSDDVVPLERTVYLQARTITVAAALTDVLLGVGVDVVFDRLGGASLVERPRRVQTGSIAGRVTSAETGTGLGDAEVIVEGTRLRVLTGPDGHYRVGEVEPGSYTLTARRIGYTRGTQSATVTAGQETNVNFGLQVATTRLDELVVTGTVVPTEVKALPTPVTVITADDIARQRPSTVQELFRQAVPGAVSWDDPNNPYYTAFAVRGASTLAGQVGQMKVFVDGIESAQTSIAAVDPSSIDRVEVIRGPQAAAIYGSDAIGGVIQVFTKRGDATLDRPQLSAEAAVGLTQTPYEGFDGVVRQQYKASVRGGGSDVSYNVGGAYSRTADYLPRGELSAQSNPSVYGGMRFTRGIIAVDLSGRYYVQNTPSVLNPEFARTGFLSFSTPNYQPQQYQNQTVGLRLSLSPTAWWQHTVTVGLDRVTQDLEQLRPRLSFPGDTLLQVVNQAWTKSSVGYNTSLRGQLADRASGSLTVGFDHYRLPFTRLLAFGVLNTTGTIQPGPGGIVSAARTNVTNSGYFAQVQVDFREALFLTGGIRAEENSEFGDQLGTPVSPRVGLSYVRSLGNATLKLRGSWGRAIRGPAPGQRFAIPTSVPPTVASPLLGPERQEGWDAGADLVFGERVSLSFTYYDQTAKDLIQFAPLETSPPTQQAQNIARVNNTGVEIDGAFSLGPVHLRGHYGYARARVGRLALGYAGDLRVGDQTFMTPEHTAGASVTVAPHASTTISAGFTYVGSWNNYDYLAQYSCFGGTGPCRSSNRDYIVAYPGFVKLNANVSRKISEVFSGFLSVDNLTNNEAYEASQFAPVTGRSTMVGVQASY